MLRIDDLPNSNVAYTGVYSLTFDLPVNNKFMIGVITRQSLSEFTCYVNFEQSYYEKPSGGIPSSDMASAVQTSLGKADSAYQKPVGGIPLTDLADNTETVSGSTPSITGVAGNRYICGECSTLAITAPVSGCIDVLFESGSTATVLTVTSAKTGVSAIKWANGFNPSSLDANTTYELNILDGEFGVVGKWT